MKTKSLTVIGAGIVGLAIAVEYARSGFAVSVIEKEPDIASHQTGRNSGVIHSGPYYKPGSLKAELCTQGSGLLKRYASEHGIPFEVTGKLIVSTTRSDQTRIDEIYSRALSNGVEVEKVERSRIREIEPHCVSNYGLHVKGTAIIDYASVARALALEIKGLGGDLITGSKVSEIKPLGSLVTVRHDRGEVVSSLLINAAGLQSDRVARMAGIKPRVRIMPFKGQYFHVAPQKEHLVKGLIYPAPNPEMPFLGVHLTKTISGGVHAGPNAILALHREGYSSSKVNLRDTAEIISNPGLARFLFDHKRYAWDELLRLASRERFARDISRLVEGIGEEDLEEAPAGIRAQAIDSRGKLVDDFELQRHGNQLHILNAPSPAATASMAIAKYVRSRFISEN